MIWYLDWADENIWKTLYSNNSYYHTHKTQIYNQFYSSDKMIVHITKTHIVLCLMIFHSPKAKMIWYLDSAHQNRWKTIYSNSSYAHTHQKLFSNLLLQQWQNGGSSNKKTYYFMLDDLPLNQKQKWFDNWIQHIKTVGKHSLSVIHMLTHTRNFCPTNFTAVTKWWFT